MKRRNIIEIDEALKRVIEMRRNNLQQKGILVSQREVTRQIANEYLNMSSDIEKIKLEFPLYKGLRKYR